MIGLVRWILVMALVSACGSSADTQAVNTPCVEFATDPSTGKCFDFDNGCAPAEWPACAMCNVDADCQATEYCQSQETTDVTQTPGVCKPFAPCAADDGCTSAQHCDLAAQKCASGPSMGTLPPAPSCASNAACMIGEICPAQFGQCSPSANAAGCPSSCEIACVNDTTCTPDRPHCNATELCATANRDPSMTGAPNQCSGWCVP